MKSTLDVKNDTWIWAVIHVSCLVVIPVMISVMTSCMDKPKVKNADLASEVSAESVDDAFNKAFMSANPYQTTEEQAVLFRYDYRVEASDPIDYQQEVHAVKRIVNTPETFTIVYDETLTDLESNAPDVTKEREMEFNPILAPSSANFTLMSRKISPQVYQLAAQSHIIPYADREYTRQTFHGLRVSELTRPAPEHVQERENCGGLPNCEMRITRINYEMALWYSDVDYDKIMSEVEISTDVPFLGTVISDCSTQQQFIDDRDYVIRTCKKLRDFLF